MKEYYYFLFILAFVYTLIATIQDIRKREVSNWLNFSLVAFALGYRTIYSSLNGKYEFFYFGLFGYVLFVILANLFYYSKVFAGGDAKLLMAYGAILPFESLFDLAMISTEFILILFLCGALYSLIYSFVVSVRKYKEIMKRIKVEMKNNKIVIFASFVCAIILILLQIVLKDESNLLLFTGLFLIIIAALYVYLKAIEEVCFVKLVSAQELTEGDWLKDSIKVHGKIIKKTVYGLSLSEIKLIRRYNKKVWVKYGVPFVPAFLLALIMVSSFLISGFDFAGFLLSLF